MRSHTYETKCRKCSRIYVWVNGNIDLFTREQFLSAMFDLSTGPSLYDCKCTEAGQTFHDIVSVTTGSEDANTPINQ